MNIYTLGTNFEPNHCILTGAGSGRWQNSVSYGKCKIVGVKLPDFTYGIQIYNFFTGNPHCDVTAHNGSCR